MGRGERRRNTMEAKSRRPRRAVLVVEAAVLATLAAIWISGRTPPAPSVRWQFGETRTAQEPFAELPADHPVRLQVEIDEPLHVYVASWDMLRGNVALWPSTRLKSMASVDPLAAGTHELPGRWEQQDIVWHVGDGVGVTTFLVIASRRPLDDLAAAMLRFRQMGNAAFPDRRECATYAPDAGMDVVPPLHAIAHDLLKLCAEQAGIDHDGPMVPVPDRDGVWMKAMRVVTPLPEEPMTAEQAQQELAERLSPLEGLVEKSEAKPPADAGMQGPPAPPSGR